jgi:TPR repeat protein
MRRRLREALVSLALAIALIAGLAVPSLAGFDDGVDAYKRGDYAAAFAEWKPLAEQGYASAQFNLGTMYMRGEGVSQDYAEAVEWLRRAAAQDHAKAHYFLSFAYTRALGVPRDDGRAVESLRRAAELGFVEAQYRLGLIYTEKRPRAPQDYVLAYVWFDLAAAQGSEKAARKRRFVAERMMRSEIAKARRLARELRLKRETAPGGPRQPVARPESASPFPFGVH